MAGTLHCFRLKVSRLTVEPVTVLFGDDLFLRRLARQAVLDGDLDGAEKHLRTALETNDEASLEHEIRLRLGRVLKASGRLDEAIALLAVQDTGAFAAAYHELTGDIRAAQGDETAARSAYQDAISRSRADGLDASRVELKLENLGRTES